MSPFCDRCYVGDGFCSLHPRPVIRPVNPAAYAAMLEVLEEAREELATRADVSDGIDGPRPDWCMSLLEKVEDAIRKATKG